VVTAPARATSRVSTGVLQRCFTLRSGTSKSTTISTSRPRTISRDADRAARRGDFLDADYFDVERRSSPLTTWIWFGVEITTAGTRVHVGPDLYTDADLVQRATNFFDVVGLGRPPPPASSARAALRPDALCRAWRVGVRANDGYSHARSGSASSGSSACRAERHRMTRAVARVDAVTLEARAAVLARRSIKAAAKRRRRLPREHLTR
jgi:hypothetical protein